MNNLKEARKAAKMSQEELAEKTKTSQGRICAIERGVNRANQETREKIEGVIGKIDWLATCGIKLRAGTYFKCEKILQHLIAMSLDLDKKERNELKTLINEYFK
jgi:transcriptional regulator with XRE-family HTH domain